MSAVALEKQFHRMGARVAVDDRPAPSHRRWPSIRRPSDIMVTREVPDTRLTLDVRRDEKGEYFYIRNEDGKARLQVVNVASEDRHLLLFADLNGRKSRYLLGHDERHWFVAAIPESTPATTVAAAKAALKPPAVLEHEVKSGIRTKNRNRRRNEAWLRQGEWFFVPDPLFEPPASKLDPVLYDEAVRRSNSAKPHICEELFRFGGDTVYVGRSAPNGLTQDEYDALSEDNRRKRAPWTVMRRNPNVYVRGKVRHSDHATLDLGNVWHKVLSNTENLSYAMRTVAFLD